MHARPLLLILLPLAAAAAYFAARRVTASSDTDAAKDSDASITTPEPPTDAGTWDMIRNNVSSAAEAVSESVRRIFTPPASAKPYQQTISFTEQAYGIPESLLARLLYEESRFRPDIITGQTKSPVGAVGIAQFMPATAKEWGVNPLDPDDAIDGAGRYLVHLYNRFGSWDKALAAYNWGPGNVSRKGLDKAPAETRQYVAKILNDVEV